MYQMKFRLLLILMLSFASTPVVAQTAYLRSTEPCQVTIYPAPAGKPLSEKLACDQSVEVLERQGSFMRIRTGDDRVVWVDDVSTTTNVPPGLEVQRLTEYQGKIEKELEQLREQVRRLSEQSEKLLEALLASQAGGSQQDDTKNTKDAR
jgi:hypothetical protein